jgi:hypothetical protein
MATLFLERPWVKGSCWHLVKVEDDPRRQTAIVISEVAADRLKECGLPVHPDRRFGPLPPMPEVNRRGVEHRLALGGFRIPKLAAKWLGVNTPEKK